MNHHYVLIINVLISQFLFIFCKSQKTNELIFEQLVLQSIASHAYPIDSVKGFLTETLNTKITRNPAAPFDLIIESPTVDFRKVEKNRFERSLESIVNFQDSSEHSFILTHKDTLDGKALSAVRKSSYPELRGRNPRFAAKYLGPTLLIGTAIAGIISLFYLRS